MLDELKFVMGAVAKKDFIPAMTHFAISRGRVRSYNGMIALCSPIPFNIDCIPKAAMLVKAIQNCNDTAALSITEAGRLRVQSGTFRAFVDCVMDEPPHVEPEGEVVQINGEELIKAFRVLLPFIGEDASRPWANGILLKGQSAFATNNVTLVEYWVGSTFPIEINIPKAAIKEIIRINEPPEYAQLSKNSVTFHFSGDRWIRSQLFSTEWPNLNKVLSAPSAPASLPSSLFEALETIRHFADKEGRVFISDGSVRTHEEKDLGACVDLSELQFEGIYQIDMLRLLNGVAVTADFSTYPRPCLFYGDRLRGAIIGMRIAA